MFKLFSIALLSATLVLAPTFGAEAGSNKKPKMKPDTIEQTVKKPNKQKKEKSSSDVSAPAPTPAPAPKPAPAPGTIDPYTQSQIDKALARPPSFNCTYCAAFAASQGDLATVAAIGAGTYMDSAATAQVEAAPAVTE